MRLKPAIREFLREAFLTALPVATIAKRKRLSCSTVKRFWADEKARNLLPAVRPHFAAQTAAAADAGCDQCLDDDFENFEDSDEPIASPNPGYAVECDAMLASLRKHHGEPWRRFQNMPAHVLQMEISTPPSPARVADFARIADVYTGALLKRQAVRA